MRTLAALCVLGASVACAWAAPTIPFSEFKTRRTELRKHLDGTLVLFARQEGADEVFRTSQEPNFFYLSGYAEPGAILLLTRDSEVLFLAHRNPRRETYNGHRPAPEDKDVREVTGFDEVLPTEKFEATLAKSIESGERVFALTSRPEATRIRQLVPFREVVDAQRMIAEQRGRKSNAEIAAITRATDVTVEAQRAAWKRTKPGLYEYQSAATFTALLLDAGCEGHAYAPIFGSGPNGTVLHYSANTRRMDAGEVMVIDAAAQCGGYASDVTRTIPVNGKFTARQREIYEIVLGAQKAAIAAMKPGLPMADLTRICREYFDAHGKLGKYLPHGVSHHVGLDVHDPGPMVLAAGMVVTIEPGLYLPEENIGVRIEDTVLITETGVRVLSAALPREPDEVEKAMAH